MISVTKPFLPPISQYQEHLNGIWARNHLTNEGPLSDLLETKISQFLDLPHSILNVANGGLALQLLIHALDVQGEIITTPFSYIATSSCALWEGCSLIYADIDAKTLNIDPNKIESYLTPNTKAILATHVFGNPCEVESIEQIARKYNLTVIYDASHCFNVKYKGRSLLEWGDASFMSTHATKIFHTVEGGVIYSKHEKVRKSVEWMRRYGHKDFDSYFGVGINAKLSELHAAMGLCNLDYLPSILERRKEICRAYDDLFSKSSIATKALNISDDTVWNYSYYPVLLENEEKLLELVEWMSQKEIFLRRYFYPSLDRVFIGGAKNPVCENIAKRIVCFPLFYQMDDHQLALVAQGLQAFERLVEEASQTEGEFESFTESGVLKK